MNAARSPWEILSFDGNGIDAAHAFGGLPRGFAAEGHENRCGLQPLSLLDHVSPHDALTKMRSRDTQGRKQRSVMALPLKKGRALERDQNPDRAGAQETARRLLTVVYRPLWARARAGSRAGFEMACRMGALLFKRARGFAILEAPHGRSCKRPVRENA